jgi:hypothetical protein
LVSAIGFRTACSESRELARDMRIRATATLSHMFRPGHSPVAIPLPAIERNQRLFADEQIDKRRKTKDFNDPCREINDADRVG